MNLFTSFFFVLLPSAEGRKGKLFGRARTQESSKLKKREEAHIFFLIGGIFEVVLMMVTDGSFVSLNTFDNEEESQVNTKSDVISYRSEVNGYTWI